MIDIFYSIAPIFVLIVLGFALRRGGVPSVEFWNLNDRLVYWIFLPALLFSKTSTLELAGEIVGSYAIAICGGFAAAMAFGYLAPKLLRMAPPPASSVLQGATRHNTFVALAVAERLYGADGLALAAVATALLIPVTNVAVVSSMVAMLHDRGGGLFTALIRDLARNPLIFAVLAGVGYNVLDLPPAPVAHDALGTLGQAALPVVLLCVGANIRISGMGGDMAPAVVSMVGKLVVFPAAVFGLALAAGLPPLAATVASIFGAVPTASASFTLARQLGGDAPLMATIVTLQTAISFVTMPITVYAAHRYFLGNF